MSLDGFVREGVEPVHPSQETCLSDNFRLHPRAMGRGLQYLYDLPARSAGIFCAGVLYSYVHISGAGR